MRKLRTVAAPLLLTLLLCATSAYAQSAGSFAGDFQSANVVPTVTCPVTDINACSANGFGFLQATIKVPSANSGKSLFLLGSLETALMTQTKVASKNGSTSTSTASGSIVVQPEVTNADGSACTDINANPCAVYPPRVTFDQRTQSLTANLLGLGCTADLTGAITCTSPETIDLLLSTMSAHSFNFLIPNLRTGAYKVKFNIFVTTTARSDSLAAGASVSAGVAAGSL